MLITDGSADWPRVERVVAAALGAGIDAVQLREKSLGSSERCRWARRLAAMARQRGALLIVNDDLDAAGEADGVHLGWRSVGVPEAQSRLGRAVVGVSTHSLEEALRAQDAGASYVTLGPIFETPSKRGLLAPCGLEPLAAAIAALEIPVVALGGISTRNAASVSEAGARHLAFIGAAFDAPDAAAAVRSMRTALESGIRQGGAAS